MKVKKSWLYPGTLTAFLLEALFPAYAVAQGYGIYDARALAMGGTAVAVANTNHAQFYNPALIAIHDGHEEKTKDGRVYFPMVSSQISEALEELINIDDDELELGLTNSIDAFNVDPNAENAGTALASSEDLLDAINRVNGGDASFDGFFGISISEPSDREGGAFYLGARAIGGGVPDITDTDIALLEDYVEALEFVSSNGQQGDPHPELFNGDGSLIDPTANLTSTATGRGAILMEFGVSLSRAFSGKGRPISVGITPKLMKIRTYEAVQTVNGGGVTTESDEEGFQTFNADVGFAMEVTEHVRFGLAVRDVFDKSFATELGGTVRIKPKPRLGFGYVRERYQIGLDYDIASSEPVGGESPIQDASLGGEWRFVRPAYLRLGYRHDMQENRDDIWSAGLGLEFQTLLFDFTYAKGGDGSAAAIQMGYAF